MAKLTLGSSLKPLFGGYGCSLGFDAFHQSELGAFGDLRFIYPQGSRKCKLRGFKVPSSAAGNNSESRRQIDELAAVRGFVKEITHRRVASDERDFQQPEVQSNSYPQINVDYAESELSACGVSLTTIGDSCVVSMERKNGTAAKLMLPSGLITSFKARMWHGGRMELLHTLVSKGDGDGDAPLIQGGLSLALCCQGENGHSWSPSTWALHRVYGTPRKSIQVELMSRNEGEMNAQVKHIITLERDLLASEVLVYNSGTSPLTLTGSALCHLVVSTPDATYALGLEGSDFFTQQPFLSDFSIIPPNFTKSVRQEDPKTLWPFNKLYSKANVVPDDGLESSAIDSLKGEEVDNHKHLTEKLSRIYTSAPRSLTFIDRGKRNSVMVRRNGFEELYLLSPGSEHEWYAQYSYICTGSAALLEPIMIEPQTEWRGSIHIVNPNFEGGE